MVAAQKEKEEAVRVAMRDAEEEKKVAIKAAKKLAIAEHERFVVFRDFSLQFKVDGVMSKRKYWKC